MGRGWSSHELLFMHFAFCIMGDGQWPGHRSWVEIKQDNFITLVQLVQMMKIAFVPEGSM